MVGGRSCGFRLSQGADAALAAGRDGQVVRLGGQLSEDDSGRSTPPLRGPGDEPNRKKDTSALDGPHLERGLCAAAFSQPAEAADRPGRVAVIATPDGGIQPQAVADDAGVVHLIYFKGEPAGGDLFYVRSKPGTTEFSKPIRVNSQPGSAVAMGTIRGGQLALGRRRARPRRLERVADRQCRRTRSRAARCSTRA